ncbi:Ionotropic receptor 599 [Blattella germanica]|nr:Ionotropic receptor 599 [Blattella germanica]
MTKYMDLFTRLLLLIIKEIRCVYTHNNGMVIYIEEIITAHFNPDFDLIISLPNIGDTYGTRILKNTPYEVSDMQFEWKMLSAINQVTLWRIEVQGSSETYIDVMNHMLPKAGNYIIIFTFNFVDDINSLLEKQIVDLRDTTHWNPRAKFLVVVTNIDTGTRKDIAFIISRSLKKFFIINVIILIPATIVNPERRELEELDLELYTWYPFKEQNCGELKSVELVEKWNISRIHKFKNITEFYPIKIPKYFMKCPIKISSFGIRPYIIPIEDRTYEETNNLYNLSGIMVEYIINAIEEMNLTAFFYPPVISTNLLDAVETVKLLGISSDIVLGPFPLLSLLESMFDHTVPYFFDSVHWLVPCPGPISKVERILSTYSESVWIAIICTFSCSALTFWFIAKRDSDNKESCAYVGMSNSFYNTWAISLGISVTKIPIDTTLRLFFILFVWYSFAMSTIFQAFFMAYLVEPGYENPITTFEELIASNVPNFKVQSLDAVFTVISSGILRKFGKNRVTCVDYESCVKAIILHRNASIVTTSAYSKYIANNILSGVDKSKGVCNLNGVLASVGMIALLDKGSPFLERINVYVTRSFEASLLKRYWSKIMTNEAFIFKNKSILKNDSLYLVFNLSHLAPCFFILVFGYIISFVVYIVEVSFGFSKKN